MPAATPGPAGFPAAPAGFPAPPAGVPRPAALPTTAADRAPGPEAAPDGGCDAPCGGVNGPGSPVAGMPAPAAVVAGFAEGGALDALPPGADLAFFADRAWAGGFGTLSDDELIGLVRAWRRLSSWAAAGELAAVAELSGRRERAAQSDPAQLGCAPVDYVADELACALTLTRRSAGNLADRAAQLADLPTTAAALERGQIDMPKALTIIDGLYGTDTDVALAVEDKVLPKAPWQTTGELRAALRRAVLAIDPEAARRRREMAEKSARVELWDEPAGTKALAGRGLPPAGVLAADKRIAAIARDLKNRGADGSLELLRAKVYLALLAGQPLGDLVTAPPAINQATQPPQSAATLESDSGAAASAAGESAVDGSGADGRAAEVFSPGDLARLAGWVNLTVPLTTLLDLAEEPGEVAGFGPVDAHTSRLLTDAAAHNPATRWCVTLTDDKDRVIGHGCQRTGPPPSRTTQTTGPPPTGPAQRTGPPPGRTTQPTKPPSQTTSGHTNLMIKLDPLPFAGCDHRLQTGTYRPSPRLRHLIEIRDRTCSFPGCRQPAIRCDTDHTIPYDRGGRTCPCNLAPLCRTHHQLKQALGWQLHQPSPGVFEWITPSGRKYTIRS